MAEHFTRVQFSNFKAFPRFSIALRGMNILVGPNNSGKSTILSAFRALETGLRRANARRPDILPGPDGERFGYELTQSTIPISLENVHTEYVDQDSSVAFTLSNGNQLVLFFPEEGGARLFPRVEGPQVRRPKDFREQFPVSVALVPVLGPIEHKEAVLDPETVRRSLMTHRASSHFRNYWYHFPEGFTDFSDLVHQTWPEMTIEPPERPSVMTDELLMFCTEHRMTRELFWAGFGFQVWCQLLTHLVRASSETILVIDEPEIYLHPEVQRQLLAILRDTGSDVLVATHSTEIMGEADPSEIILVNKTKRSGDRLRDVEGVQQALDMVGSVQNITLTQLARSQKLLFVEGSWDWGVLRRFARRVGLRDLAAGKDVTAIESGGFTSWDRIKALAWGFDSLLDSGMSVGAVFDSDFWCTEELEALKTELEEHLDFAHFLARKELENYLLEPAVLEKALQTALREQERRSGKRRNLSSSIAEVLATVTTPQKASLQGQYVTRRVEYLEPRSRRDRSTIATETIERFESLWSDITLRMQVVKGKDTLRALRAEVQQECGVTLTDIRIIDAFEADEIPRELLDLLRRIDRFRSG